MARTGRPGLSHEQKAELWQRWKAGETLSDIGRALGKHAAFGVRCCRGKGRFCPGALITQAGIAQLGGARGGIAWSC